MHLSIYDALVRHGETLRRVSFADVFESFGLNFVPRNHVIRIRLMIGNSAIQFGHLRLSQWRYGIALYDVVPKGFNKLNLFIHTKLSSTETR